MVFGRNKDDGQSQEDRPKFQGNWKCAGCGAEITELPFEPTPGRDVMCKDCWAKQRETRGPRRSFDGPRPRVQGNWKCAGCGAEITELPFNPSPGRDVFCRDCWAKNRA